MRQLIACCNVGAIGFLLDDDVSRAMFERHLARVGQLQIPLVLARRSNVSTAAGIYGYIEFLRSGAIPIWTAAITCLIGGSYHFWSAMYHGVIKAH
jgi:hypothetical protein